MESEEDMFINKYFNDEYHKEYKEHVDIVNTAVRCFIRGAIVVKHLQMYLYLLTTAL